MTKLTVGDIRKAVAKLRESQVRPDLDGNIRFLRVTDKYGNFVSAQPFDERDSWVCGKPLGAVDVAVKRKGLKETSVGG